jgi:hypothetical protein
VLVAMEGEISNFERLIELAKECGFKILLAAMPRNLKRAEAELAEILALASVEAAASLAEQITSGAPGVCILATSREPRAARDLIQRRSQRLREADDRIDGQTVGSAVDNAFLPEHALPALKPSFMPIDRSGDAFFLDLCEGDEGGHAQSHLY